jgi:hypothetical protein
MRVDLPAPEGPIIAVREPDLKCPDIPLMILLLPAIKQKIVHLSFSYLSL